MSRDTIHKEPGHFSKSVGAGMKSVFGGGGKTYYVIEHKTPSEQYKAGQSQEIIVDYIELGRDSKCQVRFGESSNTVSRRHAAITKEGTNWVLKHLGSNPTLINGKAVAKQWFLQNGDEIQLSYEGPKMGFLVPTNNVVSSIGFSRRLSLFGQQALRPYKQAVLAISIIFLIALGALSYFIILQKQEMDAANKRMVEAQELIEEINSNSQEFQGDIDSLHSVIAGDERRRRDLINQVNALQEMVENVPQPVEGVQDATPVPSTLRLDNLFPSVYFITVEKIRASYEGTTEEITDYRWTGTGFLLDDGKFITARHVTEGWFFLQQDDTYGVALNKIASNGGEIIAYFTAYSPDGTRLEFNSSQFTVNRSNDRLIEGTDPSNGRAILITDAMSDGGNDWAYYDAGRSGAIEPDVQLSSRLEQQHQLHILGYPPGTRCQRRRDFSHIRKLHCFQ